jgi:hypothetical protein
MFLLNCECLLDLLELAMHSLLDERSVVPALLAEPFESQLAGQVHLHLVEAVLLQAFEVIHHGGYARQLILEGLHPQTALFVGSALLLDDLQHPPEDLFVVFGELPPQSGR